MARPASPHRVSPARFLRDLCVVLVITGLAVAATTRWVATPWVVEGPSMEPVLHDGDRVLVDLWTFRDRLPRPGDIVIVAGPGDETLVKRIAREPYPGNDPYPAARIAAESPLEPLFIVLGDNREHSRDSREFGRVPLNRIEGRIAWRYWPLRGWGSIE